MRTLGVRDRSRYGRHNDGMKRLLLVLPLLVASSAAQAAPIYLRCDETEVLKHTQEIKTGDRVSNPVRSMEPWKDIAVVIYPERGEGKVWSRDYSLETYPDKY